MSFGMTFFIEESLEEEILIQLFSNQILQNKVLPIRSVFFIYRTHYPPKSVLGMTVVFSYFPRSHAR